ncbi:hypothetical protein ACJJTC_003824 [Scirpophaga incertulas]
MPRDHSDTTTDAVLRSSAKAAARSRCPHSLRERHNATGSIATRCGLRERPPRSFASYTSSVPDTRPHAYRFDEKFRASSRASHSVDSIISVAMTTAEYVDRPAGPYKQTAARWCGRRGVRSWTTSGRCAIDARRPPAPTFTSHR